MNKFYPSILSYNLNDIPNGFYISSHKVLQLCSEKLGFSFRFCEIFLGPINRCNMTRIFKFIGHNDNVTIFNRFQAFESKLFHLRSLCFAVSIVISQKQCCNIPPKAMLTVNNFQAFKDFKGFKWPIINTFLTFSN